MTDGSEEEEDDEEEGEGDNTGASDGVAIVPVYVLSLQHGALDEHGVEDGAGSRMTFDHTGVVSVVATGEAEEAGEEEEAASSHEATIPREDNVVLVLQGTAPSGVEEGYASDGSLVQTSPRDDVTRHVPTQLTQPSPPSTSLCQAQRSPCACAACVCGVFRSLLALLTPLARYRLPHSGGRRHTAELSLTTHGHTGATPLTLSLLVEPRYPTVAEKACCCPRYECVYVVYDMMCASGSHGQVIFRCGRS